jgi:hypothetical protein
MILAAQFELTLEDAEVAQAQAEAKVAASSFSDERP